MQISLRAIQPLAEKRFALTIEMGATLLRQGPFQIGRSGHLRELALFAAIFKIWYTVRG